MSTPVVQRNTAVASETLYGKSYRSISDQLSSDTNVARYGSSPTIAPTTIPVSKSEIGLDNENGSPEIRSNRFFIDVLVSILAIRIGLWSSKRLPDSTNTRITLPGEFKSLYSYYNIRRSSGFTVWSVNRMLTIYVL